MRISDWSSDVCSSDLEAQRGGDCFRQQLRGQGAREFHEPHAVVVLRQPSRRDLEGEARLADELGRASCRERVCQYVSLSVVAVSLTKKYTHLHVVTVPYHIEPD